MIIDGGLTPAPRVTRTRANRFLREAQDEYVILCMEAGDPRATREARRRNLTPETEQCSCGKVSYATPSRTAHAAHLAHVARFHLPVDGSV